MAKNGRDEAGRFLPGQSGNPKGAPSGRRTVEAVVRRILDEQVPLDHPIRQKLEIEDTATRREAVARVFVGMLEQGHPLALRLFLDRDWPATQHVLLEDDTRPVPELIEEADHVEAVKQALAESDVLH